MEPVTLLTGAGLVCLGLILGRLSASRKPEPSSPSQKNRCSCGHTLAFHSPDKGTCAGTQNGEPLRYDSFDTPTAWEKVPCTCQQYDGPQPVDRVDWTAVTLPTPDLRPDTARRSLEN